MIGFEFDSKDLTRIMSKLKVLEDNIFNKDRLYFSIEYFAKQYVDGLIKVIGKVEAADMTGEREEGGADATFSMLSKSLTVHWEPLDPSTIRRKIKSSKGPLITFWYNTGEVLGESFRSIRAGSYRSKELQSVFAGIDKDLSPAAYMHALKTETGDGGQWPARALFTIANEVFLQHQASIVETVRRNMMDGVDWGR